MSLSSRALVGALVFAVSTGCFYAPTVAPCAVSCPSGSCPAGLQCIDGLCRADDSVSCECQHGTSRPCGIEVGECQRGTQTCTNGAWGSCSGEITPTEELCDGRDNDCDGLTDQSNAVVLYEGQTTDWRFLSLDGGFALITAATTDAGLELTQVRRVEPGLSVGMPSDARLGAPSSLAASPSEHSVYLAWAADGGIALSVWEGGAVRALESVPDASVLDQVRLGVGENVVAHWDVFGSHTVIARWTREGQLRDVTDTLEIDAGLPFVTAFTPALSNRGHYAVWTCDPPPDAGLDDYARMVLDTRTLSFVRTDGPYYQATTFRAVLLERPVGDVAVVYSYSYAPDSWSGVYFNPDLLTLTTSHELTLEEIKTNALAWGASDAVLDDEGRVSIVYQDNIDSRLVMARSVPSSPQVLKQPLSREAGFGVPKLGYPGSGPFLVLAWRGPTAISARRICPVR